MTSLAGRGVRKGAHRRRESAWRGIRLAVGPAGAGATLLLSAPRALAASPVAAAASGLAALTGPGTVSTSVQILLALTVLSLAPAVLLLMTSFTRIVVVLSFARSALATDQLPPNQVIVGLALFLTLFVMGPTFGKVYRQAWVPYQKGRIDINRALGAAEQPLGAFMLRQTRTADLDLFAGLARRQQALAAGSTPTAAVAASGTGGLAILGAPLAAGAARAPRYGPGHLPPFTVLVPAFVVSELKTAFEMGFVLFVPFVVIDLVVGSTLMATGMVMLPPMLISLPFKILLFVLVDGWTLLVQSLVLSFH